MFVFFTFFVFFFFKQKTAYEMHISDWSSDVCSSDLYRHPLSDAFVRAAQQAGVPFTDDFNGARQAGAGFFQTTTHNGRRGSTAATYLKAVRGNPLLTVRTEASLDHLLSENGAAAGAAYRDKAGHRSDRKSGGEGKSVAVSVDFGCRRCTKKKNKNQAP